MLKKNKYNIIFKYQLLFLSRVLFDSEYIIKRMANQNQRQNPSDQTEARI